MKRLFLFLSAAVLCTAALAREGATDAVRTAQSGDTLFYDLQAIEVIASRATGGASNSTTTIKQEEISKRNFGYDLPSLLMFTPSLVSISETGCAVGGASMSIRGTDATRINVSVNGMPLNDPDSHSMYWYDTPDLAGSSSSVQIVRGAGTTTAGTASFGGAVNIATASLKDSFGGDASISYGAFNTSRQSVHIGSGLMGGHWIVDTRLSHIGSDGYIDRASTDMKSYMFQAGWFNGGTMIKFVSFGGKTKTYLTYNGVTEEDIEDYGPTYHTSGQYSTSDGPFVLKDGTHVNYFADQTDNYLQLNNQLLLDKSFSAKWKMGAMLHYNYGKGYYRQYKDDAWLCGYNNLVEGGDQADLIRRKEMTANTFGAAANANYTAEKLNLVFGASYLHYNCPHYGTIDWIDAKPESLYGGFRWYDNNVWKNDASIYAKADYKPLKNLWLHAELQWRNVSYRVSGTNDNYDWNQGRMQEIAVDRKWGFLNPDISVTYEFLLHHTLKASFAIAHKEPTRSDFTDRYNFSTLTDEPRPEELLDWELSYNFSLPSVQAGVNLYHMKYNDQLVPTGITNDSDDNLNINVDNSYRSGMEMTVNVLPLKWLTIGGNCTLSQNRILDFDEVVGSSVIHHDFCDIAYSPSVTASGVVDFHLKGVEAAVKCQYVGKQYISCGSHDDLSLPGYFVGNIELGYTLPKKLCGTTIRFGAKISNFTSTRYCSYGYGGSYMDGAERRSWKYLFPQAPCSAIGSMTLSF